MAEQCQTHFPSSRTQRPSCQYRGCSKGLCLILSQELGAVPPHVLIAIPQRMEMRRLSYDTLESALEPLDGVLLANLVRSADGGVAASSSCDSGAWSSPVKRHVSPYLKLLHSKSVVHARWLVKLSHLFPCPSIKLFRSFQSIFITKQYGRLTCSSRNPFHKYQWLGRT